LTTFVADYYLPSRISVSAEYAKNLFAVVFRFSRGLGRAAKLADLNTQQVCNYLTAYAQRWSARSTNDQRQRLLMLWTAAYKRRLTKQPPQPDLIRVLPFDTEPPEAWCFAQVQQLMEQVDRLRGSVGDLPAAWFWRSLFLSTYWTGCRIGALTATPSDCYRSGEGVLVRKQKNHKPQWFCLPLTCCEAIDATKPGEHAKLWPWPYCRRHLFTVARQVIEAAGLPYPKTGRQLFHRMRRTTLTLCASVDLELARRQAGHADSRTTIEHYIDPRLARGQSAADVLPDPMQSGQRFRIVS